MKVGKITWMWNRQERRYSREGGLGVNSKVAKKIWRMSQSDINNLKSLGSE